MQPAAAGDRDLARELGAPGGIGSQFGDTGVTEGGDLLGVAVAETGFAVGSCLSSGLEFGVRLGEVGVVGGAPRGIEALLQPCPAPARPGASLLGRDRRLRPLGGGLEVGESGGANPRGRLLSAQLFQCRTVESGAGLQLEAFLVLSGVTPWT